MDILVSLVPLYGMGIAKISYLKGLKTYKEFMYHNEGYLWSILVGMGAFCVSKYVGILEK